MLDYWSLPALLNIAFSEISGKRALFNPQHSKKKKKKILQTPQQDYAKNQ